jgi:ubiquinone biosynthesis protein
VPPRSIDAIYKTIEEETGKAVDQSFAYIDPVPLGSASIGQVHKAKLLDGKEVCSHN